MPVSDQRFAEIFALSNGEQGDAEALAFCRETTDPEELHSFADTWNWDEGTWALEEILRNPACEAATALMIYWKAAPEYFLQFADREGLAADPIRSFQLESFDFVAELEQRYLAGAFPVGSISFDPRDPNPDVTGAGIYDDYREKFVRALPEAMYAAVRPKA
jgi:hypothetical protein